MQLNIAYIALIILIIPTLVFGGRIEKEPITLHQPDNTVIQCYISGDEFYHRVFDKDNFTIVHDKNGWYCYAIKKNGKIISSGHKAGKANPFDLNLTPELRITEEEYLSRRPAETRGSFSGPYSGVMTNIAIFVRFNDDQEFSTSREFYDNFFNAEDQPSLMTYYTEVSYNNLTIGTDLFPVCNSGDINVSYQDTNNRSYYLSYNEATNPDGYKNNAQKRQREEALIKHAIYSVKEQIETELTSEEIDINNDGYIDNVHFITKGGFDSWSEILWAHQSVTDCDTILIHGKEIKNYTLIPEMQQSVRLSCHEVFHSLGAPDLYHYSYDGFTPVGPWDIMDVGTGHMLAYMKWKYSCGTWIENIPIITIASDIEIHSLLNSDNQAIAIPSPYGENQLFILEYRKKEGLFEENLPQEGLIIYRVDTTKFGNASGSHDEIYIFRDNGTPIINGNIYSATFSQTLNKTSFNTETNPYPFVKNGCPINLFVNDIGIPGETISAHIVPESSRNITEFSGQQQGKEVILQWNTEVLGDSVLILHNSSPEFIEPDCHDTFMPGDILANGEYVLYIGNRNTDIYTNPVEGITNFFKAFTISNGNYSGDSLIGVEVQCNCIDEFPYTESFEPRNTKKHCWSQSEYGSGGIDEWENTSNPGFGIQPFHGEYAITTPTTFIYNTMIFKTPEIAFDTSKVYLLSYAHYALNNFSSEDNLNILVSYDQNDDWEVIETHNEICSRWEWDSIAFKGLSNESKIGFQAKSEIMNLNILDYIEIKEYNTDFHADTTWGSAPLEVKFYNQNPAYTNCTWDFGDGTYSSDIHPYHTYTQQGVYSVSLTTTFDTIPDTETKLNYIVVGYTGLTGYDKEKIDIHPNPATNYIYFNSTEAIIKKYEIRNTLGQCLRRGEINTSSGKIMVDEIDEGIYFISFYLNDKTITKKMIII